MPSARSIAGRYTGLVRSGEFAMTIFAALVLGEQISGWLKGGNERRLRAVSCETIQMSYRQA